MRLQVRYSGRVQGVGFRATARSVMTRFPVTGWVRNEPDGSVLLEVQGEDDIIRGALADLRNAMSRNIHSELAVPIDPHPGEHRFDVTH